MNPITFLSELMSRLKTEKPAFFIKLQWISGLLAAICFSIIGYNAYYAPIQNVKLLEVANSLAWAFAGVFLTGQLPSNDKKEITETPINNA